MFSRLLDNRLARGQLFGLFPDALDSIDAVRAVAVVGVPRRGDHGRGLHMGVAAIQDHRRREMGPRCTWTHGGQKEWTKEELINVRERVNGMTQHARLQHLPPLHAVLTMTYACIFCGGDTMAYFRHMPHARCFTLLLPCLDRVEANLDHVAPRVHLGHVEAAAQRVPDRDADGSRGLPPRALDARHPADDRSGRLHRAHRVHAAPR
mmetsp:Transcript_34784/g.96020  ORF Transcript_34784/g.96020 Transcript_34784/m.96020 type:complete len:207 (-) Transcript_34784:485-1105(-)